MELKTLDKDFSVCRLRSTEGVDWSQPFTFFSRTDEELSLVCPIEAVPEAAERRDDGWRGFRIQGELDFGLIGILARLSAVLAEKKIGISAVSTYNTDYIFVKRETFDRALDALAEAGYTIV